MAALAADGRSVLRNIGSWRVKETDRIAAMAAELRKVGAVVEEGEDWLAITPPAQRRRPTPPSTPTTTTAWPCAFSLVALLGAPVRINDPKCGQDLPWLFPGFASICQLA